VAVFLRIVVVYLPFTVMISPARSRSSYLRDLGEEVWKVLGDGSVAEGVLLKDFLDTISPTSKVPKALADHQVHIRDLESDVADVIHQLVPDFVICLDEVDAASKIVV
jgi:hypothetical protein